MPCKNWAWLVSKSPHLFVHNRSSLLLTADVFNRSLAPFSDVEDTAKLLVKSLSVQADSVTYQPQLPRHLTRLLTVDGQKLINTYRPPTVRPVDGDPKPFLDFMEKLFPVPSDRLEVLRWCATLIARPDVRMRYGLLLISETQGVGKTTLADAILPQLVGRWNVSNPTEQQITDSPFNSWLTRKRLISIAEIYSGDKRKASRFTDKRLKQLSQRIIFLERPHLLPDPVRQRLATAMRERMSGTTESAWMTVSKARSELLLHPDCEGLAGYAEYLDTIN